MASRFRVIGITAISSRVPGADMAAGDLARPAGAARGGDERDRLRAFQCAHGLEREQFGIARADADAYELAASHGFLAQSWVTGRAGRQTSWPPMGSDRVRPSRSSFPPCAAWKASKAASPAIVTALTTNRPPGRRLLQHRSRSPGAADCLRPRKSHRGTGEVGQAPRVPRPAAPAAPARPSLAALAAMRAARAGSRSIATGAHAAARPQPLDRDAAGTGADVPKQLAVERRQSCQGERPGPPPW